MVLAPAEHARSLCILRVTGHLPRAGLCFGESGGSAMRFHSLWLPEA